jgi:addiction module RelE/StbE family toxin
LKSTKPYRVLIPNSVKSDIKSLEKKVQIQIIELIQLLANRRYEGEKLSGPFKDLYKLKFSDSGVQYRIVYSVDNRNVVICLIMVGTRENFYLKLKKRLT